MSLKIKLYHVLTHSLDDFFPQLYTDFSNISSLEHTVNKFIKGLINYDTAQEFEHILCVPSKLISKISIYQHQDGYKIIVFPLLQFGFLFQYSRSLIKFIREINDGIIHVYGTGSFLFDFLAPALKDKKSIVHYMGGHFTWKNFFFGFIKYGIIQRITLKYPQKFFIQNKFRIEKYNKSYGIPYAKMTFVPVALEEKDYVEKNNYNNNIINILFVGRLEKAKGLIELLDVFESLNKKYSNITLNIAGNGSLLEFIKHKVGVSVKYLGQLNYDDLNKIYPESDIFVLPTHFDCFPSVLLEAGLSGLPIISTKVEGPLSIIKDGYNGFLINAGDKFDLYNKLEQLILDGELRKKLGRNGRNEILDKFTWAKISTTYFNTYKELNSKK